MDEATHEQDPVQLLKLDRMPTKDASDEVLEILNSSKQMLEKFWRKPKEDQ